MAVTNVVRQRRVREFRNLRHVLPVLQRREADLAERPQRLSLQVVPPYGKASSVPCQVKGDVPSVLVRQLNHPVDDVSRHRGASVLADGQAHHPLGLEIFSHRDVIAHVRVDFECLLVFAHVLRVFPELPQRLRDDLAQRHLPSLLSPFSLKAAAKRRWGLGIKSPSRERGGSPVVTHCAAKM